MHLHTVKCQNDVNLSSDKVNRKYPINTQAVVEVGNYTIVL